MTRDRVQITRHARGKHHHHTGATRADPVFCGLGRGKPKQMVFYLESRECLRCRARLEGKGKG